ncbi:MAG: TetR/AcrR family transcriptional regulator [Erysipelotrichaceae bacterium]|nr:TetR/AcrR family transcriptional regulator [Erysipelotrichaceae bacterium]
MNKREEIQKVAIRLFLEKGYSNVTIMDICNELNITKPTFYKYVEAKEDLIIDLYDLIVKKITSNVLKVIDVDSSIERLVLIFNELMNETIAYNSDLYSQMLIANLNENRHSFDMRDEMTSICVLLVKKAQENHEIHNMQPPEILYKTLAYCFTGYETMWCIRNSLTNLKEDFYNSMRVILNVDEKYIEIFDKYTKGSD